MLVLSRRAGQAIRIGPEITLTVIRIEGDRAVLGIAAPRAVSVLRSELADELRDETHSAARGRDEVERLLRG
jgi:carbon storage regulator